jgi:hypothetical protein
MGVPDCIGSGATTAPSSSKFLRTDRSILIPSENKRYLYHATPVNYLTWCFRKLVVDYVIRSYGYLVQPCFQSTYYVLPLVYTFDDSKIQNLHVPMNFGMVLLT